VATLPEVETAVRAVVERLEDVDPEVRSRYAVDRTVSCRISDLGVVWSARLCDEGLCDVTTTTADRAQVRLTVSSNDLLALTEGRLALTTAWATGRLRVQASPFDLLRLRALM